MNQAISASAGTGKTFRLAHRYLGLMAGGVPPDRIVALTFSRKAAGEIFDKIVEHLCSAATDGAKRAATADRIRREGVSSPPDRPEAYVGLLRKLLDHEHRLRIGTLDSFILGIVRAFPLELGVPPGTQPMDGDGGEALAVRQAILTRLFDPTRGADATVPREGDRFLQHFRLACFGRETKTLVSILDPLIAGSYGFFRQHNADRWHWGDETRIWPPDARWWRDADGPPPEIPGDFQARLADAFGAGGNPGKLAATCAEIAVAAQAHAADKPWPERTSIVFAHLLACAPHGRPPVLSYHQKAYTIPADLWAPLRRALAHCVGVEVTRALARTEGLRAVLDRYDRLYADALNTGGRFTFDDLSRLLGAEGVTPSAVPMAPNRIYIDYRLDGRLDHWLLDEFQDTSDTQWAAFANLIDEVVQSENRSFFYVGDVKQSVYGWRGGNHRLFGEVLAQYRELGPRAIVSESMAACHRSLPAVIRAVNAVFHDLASWQPEAGENRGPRPAALEAFSGAWKRHESARLGEGEGFAALLECCKVADDRAAEGGGSEEEEGTDDPAEFEAVAQVLRHAQPTRRGFTAAVLVRSNQAGRACVDVLRRQLPDVPVVHEGRGGIVDNPVVTGLLALVRYAAHPGDGVAMRHLQMSPLAAHPALQDLEALPGMLLSSIHERGFAGTLREWGRWLGPLDAFGSQRLRELLAAAEVFDAAGARDADAFADAIEAHQVKTSAAAGTVRVMTVHQAKGLGFDLVIVPFDPRAKSFEKPGDPELLAGADWVLDPPCQQALAAAAGAPLLALDAARADANFAQLCVLYVAMTRAQRALVLLVPEKSPREKTVREADLLRDRLSPLGGAGTGPGGLRQLCAVGDSAWFESTGRGVAASVASAPVSEPARVAFAAAVTRREPSKEQAEGRSFPATWLFNRESGDVLAFGSAIHRLFQKIEWIEDADVDRAIADWRAESKEPDGLLGEVEQQFRVCLDNDEVRRQLTRPGGAERAEVWREAPFNLVLQTNGTPQLISGRFDRLVVETNRAGRPVRAAVIDFKSNRVAADRDLREAVEGYQGQMADYARAAACLLGIPVEQVATHLLFTRTGRIAAAGG